MYCFIWLTSEFRTKFSVREGLPCNNRQELSLVSDLRDVLKLMRVIANSFRHFYPRGFLAVLLESVL